MAALHSADAAPGVEPRAERQTPTVAVHADGRVALSVERYLDELRLWYELHSPFSLDLRA